MVVGASEQIRPQCFHGVRVLALAGAPKHHPDHREDEVEGYRDPHHLVDGASGILCHLVPELECCVHRHRLHQAQDELCSTVRTHARRHLIAAAMKRGCRAVLSAAGGRHSAGLSTAHTRARMVAMRTHHRDLDQ
eukprot:4107220-Prymnesium_polylepis.1